MAPRFLSFHLSLLAFLFAGEAIAQSKVDRRLILQLKADIGYLASDSLEGRRTGTEGERKAAAYIERRYEAIGVPPYKNQYRYPFHFNWGKEATASTQIRIGDDFLKNDEAYALPFSYNKHVYSELIPDIMEQGNIWLVPLYADKDEAADPHFDWEKLMHDRSADAAKQGASGIMFYDGFDSKYPPRYNHMSEYEVVDIPAVFLTYKGYNKYIENNKYETYIHNQKSGLPVDLNIYIQKTDRIGNNIVAYIDNHAAYTVVLGAHYDHLGYGEDGNSLYAGKEKQVHNGADDNASGTAALLAEAAMLKKSKLHHYNYMFINFSGEELGLYGSKAIVKELNLDSTHIAYMVNMDMVGRLNDSTHALTVGGVGTSPAWGEFLAVPDKNFKINIDSSGVGPSDHTSFYYANIPVLFFFTGTHSDYHKPSDDADKINYTGEVKVINYVYSLVAGMEKKPKPGFLVTRQSTVGRVHFKVTLGIMPDYAYQDGGVRADGVSEGRPAANAGMKAGDIIIQLGEYKVQGMQSYMEALGKFKAGDKTEVKIKRGDKELTLPIEFGNK